MLGEYSDSSMTRTWGPNCVNETAKMQNILLHQQESCWHNLLKLTQISAPSMIISVARLFSYQFRLRPQCSRKLNWYVAVRSSLNDGQYFSLPKFLDLNRQQVRSDAADVTCRLLLPKTSRSMESTTPTLRRRPSIMTMDLILLR